MTEGESVVDLAIDNDVILKAASYGLVAEFWPDSGASLQIGVLGAARYVVRSQLRRAKLRRDPSIALMELEKLLSSATALEPTVEELAIAAEIELSAQDQGVSLDAGESQLAAMVLERDIAHLETGDKRAIRGLERLLDLVAGLLAISGRVACLEQVVQGRLQEPSACARIGTEICSEPAVDKALSICFGCYSDPVATIETVLAALKSYVESLRREAPRVLCP